MKTYLKTIADFLKPFNFAFNKAIYEPYTADISYIKLLIYKENEPTKSKVIKLEHENTEPLLLTDFDKQFLLKTLQKKFK